MSSYWYKETFFTLFYWSIIDSQGCVSGIQESDSVIHIHIFFLFCILFSYRLSQNIKFFKLIYFWLHWVFVAVHKLSLVAVSRSYSSLWCAGVSLRWLLLLQSMGSRHAGFSSCGAVSVVVACGLQSTGSVVVAHGFSCSAACGILPDQGLNPCPLHWQVDS